MINSPATVQSVTVYEGETGMMVIDATDDSVCQWYINRNDGLGYVTIDGAPRSSYTTSAVTLENDGFTYYCITSNAYGEIRSAIFTLKVLGKIELPEMGNESNIGLWVTLMLVGLAVIMVMLISGCRHGEK